MKRSMNRMVRVHVLPDHQATLGGATPVHRAVVNLDHVVLVEPAIDGTSVLHLSNARRLWVQEHLTCFEPDGEGE